MDTPAEEPKVVPEPEADEAAKALREALKKLSDEEFKELAEEILGDMHAQNADIEKLLADFDKRDCSRDRIKTKIVDFLVYGIFIVLALAWFVFLGLLVAGKIG
ncbi:hypothetical protein [Fibrobacter sp.]|uniref:hypothetical protein n=1 Tax=Fibrobacter sp. TaxID=35828 RepID=UPI00389098F0